LCASLENFPTVILLLAKKWQQSFGKGTSARALEPEFEVDQLQPDQNSQPLWVVSPQKQSVSFRAAQLCDFRSLCIWLHMQSCKKWNIDNYSLGLRDCLKSGVHLKFMQFSCRTACAMAYGPWGFGGPNSDASQ
jgi:hypothetical protein